jgi:hypothetical protein
MIKQPALGGLRRAKRPRDPSTTDTRPAVNAPRESGARGGYLKRAPRRRSDGRGKGPIRSGLRSCRPRISHRITRPLSWVEGETVPVRHLEGCHATAGQPSRRLPFVGDLIAGGGGHRLLRSRVTALKRPLVAVPVLAKGVWRRNARTFATGSTGTCNVAATHTGVAPGVPCHISAGGTPLRR